MHWIAFFLVGIPAAYWAWRVGEKRRKRLAKKIIMRRILGR